MSEIILHSWTLHDDMMLFYENWPNVASLIMQIRWTPGPRFYYRRRDHMIHNTSYLLNHVTQKWRLKWTCQSYFKWNEHIICFRLFIEERFVYMYFIKTFTLLIIKRKNDNNIKSLLSLTEIWVFMQRTILRVTQLLIMTPVQNWSLLNWQKMRLCCGCLSVPVNWFFDIIS